MENKRYGGRVKVSSVIMELMLEKTLGLQGQLCYVECDPMTHMTTVYMTGDKEHYPEVQEGCYAPLVTLQATVNGKGDVVKTEIYDNGTGVTYKHVDKESGSNEEDNSQEEEKIPAPYGANVCHEHPLGWCPRKQGDCGDCQYIK